jgi:hypothetical protein
MLPEIMKKWAPMERKEENKVEMEVRMKEKKSNDDYVGHWLKRETDGLWVTEKWRQ